METVLPFADPELAMKIKSLGFRLPVYFRYKGGVMDVSAETSPHDHNGDKSADICSAPYLQEVQAWLSQRKRVDVLVYKDLFFGQNGGYYAVVVRRKDNVVRETRKVFSYNLALEAGVKTAVSLLCKKRKTK